ncbi:hypothetical protein CEXT_543711 [Caerostris extrusa]|uniref:Uncharacterized protein n=1 Tax=Caerostris extrusa TaxID=172846 RepID=A0AAV4N4M1_CAEEX|nr:hypothetical protein CEXT_543711 [Caerostris extrusa]
MVQLNSPIYKWISDYEGSPIRGMSDSRCKPGVAVLGLKRDVLGGWVFNAEHSVQRDLTSTRLVIVKSHVAVRVGCCMQIVIVRHLFV